MVKDYFIGVARNYKKLFKSYTPFTVIRDIIRLFFFCSFFLIAKILGMDFEVENEYVVIISFMLFGTLWCGLFCPFGNAQYFVNKFIGQIYFKKLQFKIPAKYDKYLRNIKFLFFVLFLWVILRDNIWPEKNFPSVAYFGDHVELYKSQWLTRLFFNLKTYFVFILPLFFSRFFCKYLCYQKVLYQILNRFLPFSKIKRDEKSCISCNQCNKTCPMDIDIQNSSEIGGDQECIGCLSCVDSKTCPPKSQSLYYSWFGIKFKPLTITIIYSIIYLAATLFFMFGLGQMH